MKKIILIPLSILLLMHTNVDAQLARGADIGWLSQMENAGRTWRDSTGVQRDLLDILDDYCMNSIRLRVWVNPANGWNGEQDVVNVAQRAAAKGYRIMIDFHYSDSWADPGKQTKPAAWANYSVSQLGQAVYNHTTSVLNALKAVNVTPEWVQVGNETNNGLLWPEGQASTNMANYALFVNKGYEAVKAVFPNTKVIVHLSNGYDNALFRWNIGGLINNGAKFDIIGMSMYPDTPQEWPTYAQQTLSNMSDLIFRYNKEIMVSEIGMSVSAPQQARQFVEQVIKNLESLPDNKGLGIFWWEPQAYNWEGYDKVAWYGNWGNKPYQATDAMSGFKYNCENKPPVVSMIDPANNLTICEGTPVVLTASATDSDGLINRVHFYAGSTLLYTDYDFPFEYTWENPPVGTHELSAQAFDNLNASSISTKSVLNVYPLPNVSMISPAYNSVIPSSGGYASVVLEVKVSNADMVLTEFYNSSTLIGSSQTSSFVWEQVPDGVYPNITAVTTTSKGCKGTSSPLAFEVVAVTGIVNSTATEISIYPNPSSAGFIIASENALTLDIYNSYGQKIEQVHVTGSLNIGEHYTPGVYIVHTSAGKVIRVIKY